MNRAEDNAETKRNISYFHTFFVPAALAATIKGTVERNSIEYAYGNKA